MAIHVDHLEPVSSVINAVPLDRHPPELVNHQTRYRIETTSARRREFLVWQSPFELLEFSEEETADVSVRELFAS